MYFYLSSSITYSKLEYIFYSGCAGTGAIVNIHNALFADVINTHGNEEQKTKFLPTFVNGDHVGSFALSEPGTLQHIEVTCQIMY